MSLRKGFKETRFQTEQEKKEFFMTHCRAFSSQNADKAPQRVSHLTRLMGCV